MTLLPLSIKEKFYKAIELAVSVAEFEQWVYANEELENSLKPDDYLDLLSLNYKKSGAQYALRDLLKKQLDVSEFETYKMLSLLREAKRKSAALPEILVEFYYLYCKGYAFLQELGITYGLAVDCPRVNNTTADTWDELTQQQQQDLLASFSPELEKEIERVLYWLESGRILLTGEQGVYITPKKLDSLGELS